MSILFVWMPKGSFKFEADTIKQHIPSASLKNLPDSESLESFRTFWRLVEN